MKKPAPTGRQLKVAALVKKFAKKAETYPPRNLEALRTAKSGHLFKPDRLVLMRVTTFRKIVIVAFGYEMDTKRWKRLMVALGCKPVAYRSNSKWSLYLPTEVKTLLEKVLGKQTQLVD